MVSVCFSFPPVGWQQINMGRQLWEHNGVFRAAIEECNEIAGTILDMPLIEVLYPSKAMESSASDLVNSAQYAQPVLFAVEYALLRCCLASGVTPDTVIGHSVGEYVAAVAAGAMPVSDAMSLVCYRARLMHQMPSTGGMVAVRADLEQCVSAIQTVVADEAMRGRVAVGSHNFGGSTVLSGEWSAISAVVDQLGVSKTTRVRASHPDHSPVMHKISKQLKEHAEEVLGQSRWLLTGEIKFASTVRGEVLTSEICPEYWVEHNEGTVFFAQSMGKVIAEANANSNQLFCLEMGGGMLTRFAQEIAGGGLAAGQGVHTDFLLLDGDGEEEWLGRAITNCKTLVEGGEPGVPVGENPDAAAVHVNETAVSQVFDDLARSKDLLLPSEHRQKGFMSLGFKSNDLVQVAHRLSGLLGRTVSMALLFERSTIENLCKFLNGETSIALNIKSQNLPPKGACSTVVSGMSCLLPGGVVSPGMLQATMGQGANGISFVPSERWSLAQWFDPELGVPGKMYTKFGGFLPSGVVEQFDPAFFSLTSPEVKKMNPAQRQLLENTAQAIGSHDLRGGMVSVYVGSCHHDWERLNARKTESLHSPYSALILSLIHISEPTRLLSISYAVFCLKKKKTPPQTTVQKL
eukprot:TRINITY_DN17383_c0_g1_i2.p1 TRINITY_DN17383_c0_g1~~TRINITY_DN17383_c0_g1_i2.p1  ORF type:complete len:633 (+),score=124.01 TRINITY_DN17383_c0_g1_i2:116-2014(+)